MGTGDRDGPRQTDVLDKNRQHQMDVSDREMDCVGRTCRTENRTASDGCVGQRDGQRRTDMSDKNGQRQMHVSDRDGRR